MKKKDYMGNDQLQQYLGVCDEYIAVFDVKQYASDMECFKPLIEKFNQIYENILNIRSRRRIRQL